MTTVWLYLDTRKPRADGTCPLRLYVTKDRRKAAIPLSLALLPEHWDSVARKVVGRADRASLNSYVTRRWQEVQDALLRLMASGEERGLDARRLRDRILYELTPVDLRQPDKTRLLTYNIIRYADTRGSRTREIYLATLQHIRRFAGDAADTLALNDIGTDWLAAFDRHLSLTCPSRNTRNIHLRNIRAVFNNAIDMGYTTSYPFRRFKLKSQETAKRSLSVDQLRTLATMPLEPWQEKYRDTFMLMFCLCGINMGDLYGLRSVTPEGRVEYNRRKTGKFYSIRVEPEAMEIISRHRGTKALLDIADTYKDYRDYLHRMNNALRRLGERRPVGGAGGGKLLAPLFPGISSYWARHTWATVAALLDIPKETIAAALGHEIGSPVTSIYINFDLRKVDEANRRVLDFVLHSEEKEKG